MAQELKNFALQFQRQKNDSISRFVIGRTRNQQLQIVDQLTNASP